MASISDELPHEQADATALALQMRSARQAESRGEFGFALSIWRRIAGRFGSTRETLIGIGRGLRETGQTDEADRILGGAMTRFPDDPEIAANYALVPAANTDWSVSAQRWQSHLSRFPTLELFDGLAAEAAAQAGLHEQAERILHSALRRRGDALDLCVCHAVVAEHAQRWSVAVARWDRVLALAPANPVYEERRRKAALNETVDDLLATTVDSRHGGAPTATPLKQLARIAHAFVSLGDNCELGLVQRQFGAEPADLFRFSAVTPARMTTLMALELEPLGDPEHTILDVAGGEYFVLDDRGYLRMHSFVKTQDMNGEVYLRKQFARITLLKRTLLAHLRAGDKVLVCKQSDATISDQTLFDLHARTRALGDNPLLGIRPANQQHPPGSVAELRPGLLVGYLRHVFPQSGAELDLEGWAGVLITVYNRYRARLPVP